jgi:hypothetical protein
MLSVSAPPYHSLGVTTVGTLSNHTLGTTTVSITILGVTLSPMKATRLSIRLRQLVLRFSL